MSYTPVFTPQYQNGWKDKPDTTTPVIADALNDYDEAIQHIENHLYFFNNSEFLKIIPISVTVASISQGQSSTYMIYDGESRDIEITLYDLPSNYSFFNLRNLEIYERIYDSGSYINSYRNCLYNLKSVTISGSAVTLNIHLFNDNNGDYAFSNIDFTILACRTNLL